jgi:hypothetical protein
VRDLDDVPVPMRATPRRAGGVPYAGRRTGVIEGSAGEWLELIEGAQP